MLLKKISIVLCFAFITGTALADSKVKWGYEGNIGPANWGDLSSEFAMCKTGKVQAPIDIPSKNLAKATTPIQTFYHASKAKVINNGHTIQVDFPDGGYASLSDEDFNIVQFHMHAPGEETVDGKRYPFNAHLVHFNPGDNEGDSEAGKLAVIGIFFQEGKENMALKPIFDVMPTKIGKVVMKEKFDINTLMPKSLAYYSYAGSLTTPGCGEGVTFYILKTPVEMSAAQLVQFKKIFPMNARPVLPLNSRKVSETN